MSSAKNKGASKIKGKCFEDEEKEPKRKLMEEENG